MKKNMGFADRFIRVVLALFFIVLAITGTVSGWLLVVLLVLAGAFLITSFINTCFIYLPFGISTRRKAKNDK